VLGCAAGFPKANLMFFCRQRQVNISKWGFIFIIYFIKNNNEGSILCVRGAMAWLRLIFDMKIQPLLYASWVDPKSKLGIPQMLFGYTPNAIWVEPN